MFQNLLNLVTNNAQDSIVNNSNLPNQYNDGAIQDATNSIMQGLQTHMGGNPANLTQLFQGGQIDQNHSMVTSVISNLTQTLMQKYNMDNSAATQLAGQLVPTVINQLISKTNDSNDNSFNLTDIAGSLLNNNQGGGLGNLINKFF